MRALLLNPYAWLIAVAVSLALLGGGYWWGHTAAATACSAKAGKSAAKVEKIEDRRDENIDAIGAKTATAVAADLAHNRSDTDGSATFIRTIYVPSGCELVPDPIVRELRQATDDANAALGVGVRPGTAGAVAPGP